jgi:hypothetical protein
LSDTPPIIGKVTNEKLYRPPTDPDFPQLFALGYDRPRETWGNEDYLRIGDSAFLVPPSNIVVHDQTNNRVEGVLRTPGGIVMANGFSEKEILVDLEFTSAQEIFGLDPSYDDLDRQSRVINGKYLISPPIAGSSLAALIAQFKRTPIVPIVNSMLNNAEDIKAVALRAIQVNTKIDESGQPIPNYLSVTVVMAAFAWQTIMPQCIDFDSAWIWPLARWHWRQEYATFLPGQYRVVTKGSDAPQFPQLNPAEIEAVKNADPGDINVFDRFAHSGMTADFQFLSVSEDWIKSLDGLRTEFNKLQAYLLSDKYRTDTGQDQKISDINNLQALASSIQTLTGESNARMEPVDMGSVDDLIMTHMSITMGNGFAMQRPSQVETPLYQHIAQGDVRITATFWATSDAALNTLKKLVRESRRLARDTRFEMVAGFIGFENELASLFNVRSVVFTDIQSRSIDSLPGNYLITIEMISFQRHQRRIEELQHANGNPDDLVPQYVGLMGNDDQDPNDPRYKFWSRYLNSNPAKDSKQPSGVAEGGNSTGKGPGYDEAGRPINAWFNMAYIQEAKEQMAYLELYPDLALPTYQRLTYAIQNEIFTGQQEISVQSKLQELRWKYWNDRGRYVDPDFYMDYPNSLLARQYQNTTVDLSNSTVSVAAALMTTIADNPVTVNQIDGSLKDAAIQALFDTYPTGAFYGPDLAQSLAANQNNETESPRGNDHVHAIVPFAHPHPTNSGIIQPAGGQAHPGYNENMSIDGVNVGNVRHPASDEHNWDDPASVKGIPGLSDQITKAHKSIQGQDIPSGQDQRAMLSQALSAHHPIDIGYSVPDEHGRLIGMLSDMIEHDKSGRLVQAYPSYVLQLMDEGPRFGWVKLFPNFFMLQSIQSIDVLQDRRDPIHTCILELMNSYGNLSSYTQLQLNLNSVQAIFNARGDTVTQLSNIFGSATKLDVTDIAIEIQAWWDGVLQPFKNLLITKDMITGAAALRRKQNTAVMLQPGTRIHVRMGYGSNGAKLPILFNGRITDIGHGERVRVLAQGDGLELAKLIPSAESETNSINRPSIGLLQRLGGIVEGQSTPQSLLNQSFEPRELICQMLGSHGEDLFDYSLGGQLWNWFKSNIYASFNGAVFFENPIGISHFGNPYLFSFWDALAGRGVENIAQGDPTQINGNDSAAYAAAKTLFTSKGTDSDYSHFLIAMRDAVIKDPRSLASALIGAGDGLGSKQATNPVQWFAQGVTSFNTKMVGEAASILTHRIPQGYGEVGENVYGIYCPFLAYFQNAGSLFSKAGQAISLSVVQSQDPSASSEAAAGSAISQFGTLLNDIQQSQPGLPEVGMTKNTGPMVPGVGFNMYTHNKTVWDVITTMAQYFPPYIAAVRPFEYRSTLFFGAPYWQYRYDYDRIAASDLGDTDSANDKYYGYPVGYKVKPFVQYHMYDNKINLLDNAIQASDEDTYTDVIAMWYTGQGFIGGRPDPKPVHQTVDRQIGPAFKKTSIVNTDILGIDVAPAPSAIIGSLGMDLIPYFAVHAGNLVGSLLGAPGVMDTWVTEENMQHTARSILRDYQKLMYQGHILVLGDPTAKPYDWMHIHDDYVDIDGPAQMRRVIHHFSQDSGFITSIEPDLMVDVKGENYLTSVWTWLEGYLATNITARIAGRYLLAEGRRQFLKGLADFGLKLKKNTILQKLGNKIGESVVKNGIMLGGKAIDIFEPRALLYLLREVHLNAFAKLLSGDSGVSGLAQKGYLTVTSANYADLVAGLKNEISNTRNLLGANQLDAAANDEIIRRIETMAAETLDKDGARIYDDVLIQALRNNLLVEGVQLDTDTLVTRIATSYFARRLSGRILSKFALLRGSQAADLASVIKSLSSVGGAGASVLKSLVLLDAKGGLQGAGSLVTTSLRTALISAEFAIGTVPIFGWAIDIAINFAVGVIWTALSRWWDDETSLQMMFLRYRGAEMQAGLNGHSETIVFQAQKDSDPVAKLTDVELKALHDGKYIRMRRLAENMLKGAAGKNAQANSDISGPVAPTGSITTQATENYGVLFNNSPVSPLAGKVYNSAQRQTIVSKHFPNSALRHNELINKASDSLIGFLSYLSAQGLSIEIGCVTDGGHSPHSLHYVVRAIDIIGVRTGIGTSDSDYPWGAPNILGRRVIEAALAYGKTEEIGCHEYIQYFGIASGGEKSISVKGSPAVRMFDDNPAHIHIGMRA